MAVSKTSSHESSYFTKLKYDSKLERTTIAKYLLNFRYVFLLILIIFAVGITSYLNLPRRVNPEIKIPIVIVQTALPGAAPQEVESLITVPIEDSIAGLPNINTVTSFSQENVSILTIEFNSGVDPLKAKDDVQSQIDTITNLPADAKTPNIQRLDFENQPVWQFLIASKEDEASLMQFSNNLQDKLKKLTVIKDATLVGIESEEIQILIKSDAQKTFNVDANTLSRAIQAAIPSHPSGNLNTKNSSFSLTIDPAIKSTQQLRDLNLIINGQPVKLSEIAEVSQKASPSQAKTFWADKESHIERAVAFNVFKTESANIDRSVNDARKVVEEEIKLYPQKFKLISTIDTNELVQEQFNDVLISFRDTIILVVITLFVFLGLRQALIVAFSIPLSFLVTFTVMLLLGLTINFLTLFSLILALGLLVDDAIVTVTAMTAYWRTKRYNPKETMLLVLRDFFVPIWSTTITAVWAFLPLLLSTGIIGEFIKSIPIVVSSTLLASTAIAILITLPLTMIFLAPSFPKRVSALFVLVLALILFFAIFFVTSTSPALPLALILVVLLLAIFARTRKVLIPAIEKKLPFEKQRHYLSTKTHEYSTHGVFDSQKFALRYETFISRILASRAARRKTMAAIVIFAIFSYSLVPLGLVVNEFFPKTDEDLIFVSIELPSGTNLETTQKEAIIILEDLKNTTGLKYITAQTGQSLDLQSGGQSQAGSNNILFTVNLTDHKTRSVAAYQIADQLRAKFKSYTNGKASVIEQSGGPPAGSDIQIKLLGEDLSTLNTYADKITEFLQKEPGVNTVEKSINPGTSKIVFVPDNSKMAVYEVTENQIAQQLRSFASGATISSDVKFDSKDLDIVLRQNDQIETPQNLPGLSIRTQEGLQIPLIELGKFELRQNPTQITREDGKRTISVSGGVTKGFSVSTINKNLEDFAKTDLKLPSGYEWKTGGINEENQRSVNSILQAMALAFLLIAATMVLQFGSYRKALIILLLIPVAISGVFVIFALSGTPLSFPTLIGILALFGIVVYQAMMIVDKVNKNLRTTNMTLRQAIADAGASRVEPILFGTITTVVGLIPITLSDPLWRGLGGAIISGMLFSGLIMLVFVPLMYYMIYQNSEGK